MSLQCMSHPKRCAVWTPSCVCSRAPLTASSCGIKTSLSVFSQTLGELSRSSKTKTSKVGTPPQVTRVTAGSSAFWLVVSGRHPHPFSSHFTEEKIDLEYQLVYFPVKLECKSGVCQFLLHGNAFLAYKKGEKNRFYPQRHTGNYIR